MRISRRLVLPSVLVLTLSGLTYAMLPTAQGIPAGGKERASLAPRRRAEPDVAVPGQKVVSGRGPVFLTFGMTVEKAQEVLGGAEARVVSWYKPEGIVKEIDAGGITFHFENGKLEQVEYGERFAFKDALTPFERPEFNPPAGIQAKMRLGMSTPEVAQLIDEWRKALVKAGFRHVVPRGNSDQTEHEFFTESNTLGFGPHRSGTVPRAMWSFYAGNDGVVRGISAYDGRFSLSWVYTVEK
jgi:hypothetical protein